MRHYLPFFSLIFLLHSFTGFGQSKSDSTSNETHARRIETATYSSYPWQLSGYGLKKGEAYYQNIYLFYNHLNVGISDHFSVGLGFIPVVWDVWVTPKVSIPIIEDRFNLGFGALIGNSWSETNSATAIAYGAATIGARNKNVSLGFGYGNWEGSIARPIFTGSALFQLWEKVYFSTENYFVNNNTFDRNSLLTFELRFVKKLTVNIGLIVQPDPEGAFYTPTLGITVPIKAFSRSMEE